MCLFSLCSFLREKTLNNWPSLPSLVTILAIKQYIWQTKHVNIEETIHFRTEIGQVIFCFHILSLLRSSDVVMEANISFLMFNVLAPGIIAFLFFHLCFSGEANMIKYENQHNKWHMDLLCLVCWYECFFLMMFVKWFFNKTFMKYSGMNAKGFYLLIYWIALTTILLSHVGMEMLWILEEMCAAF